MAVKYSADRPRIVVGLMSGTSVDGIDTALVKISGDMHQPQVKLLKFENYPFPQQVRELIFELFDPKKATVTKVGYLNFLLGELYAKAAHDIAAEHGIAMSEIDLIGSHGQTIWHSPEADNRHGFDIAYTVQIGEGAVIANRTGITTVSDFRVADMALGGQGAPLVPFTEQLLYSESGNCRLLLNIGGISNVTVLPGDNSEIFAFDTGPGNMIIDALVCAMTEGAQAYDYDGQIARSGTVCETLLSELTADAYYNAPLPKSTGRERFGEQYTQQIIKRSEQLKISFADMVATATELTARTIADSYTRYIAPKITASEMIIGGGGSYNSTLIARLTELMAQHEVKVLTQEQLGYSSDAKEAIAFALLADRTALGLGNSLPAVTGARGQAILGKISLPPQI